MRLLIDTSEWTTVVQNSKLGRASDPNVTTESRVPNVRALAIWNAATNSAGSVTRQVLAMLLRCSMS